MDTQLVQIALWELAWLVGFIAGFGVLSLALGSYSRHFRLGLWTASIALVVLWFYSKSAFLLPALWLGSMAFFVILFPIVEETARTFSVYRFIPALPRSWLGIVAFASGYAILEPAYESAILVVRSSAVNTTALVAVGAATAFAGLIALSVTTATLRELGVAAPITFVVTFLLHLAVNLFADFPLLQAPFATWVEPMFKLGVFVLCAAAMVTLLRWRIRRVDLQENASDAG